MLPLSYFCGLTATFANWFEVVTVVIEVSPLVRLTVVGLPGSSTLPTLRFLPLHQQENW